MSRCEPEVINDRSPARLRSEVQGVGWVFAQEPPRAKAAVARPSRISRLKVLARNGSVQLGVVTALISLAALAFMLSK